MNFQSFLFIYKKTTISFEMEACEKNMGKQIESPYPIVDVVWANSSIARFIFSTLRVGEVEISLYCSSVVDS